jgi:hypothetical protein
MELAVQPVKTAVFTVLKAAKMFKSNVEEKKVENSKKKN